MKPIAFSYIRFSTPEQALGDSQRRQLEDVEAWAKAKGVKLDKSYADRGVASFRGKNRKKGALGRFLANIDNGTIPRGSYLVVEDIDRLSREHLFESSPIIRKILLMGITLVNLKDGDEYTEANIRADHSGMRLMKLEWELTRASGESARKSDLLSKTWTEKRRKASSENLAMTTIAPAWIKTFARGVGRAKERRYELIPERVKVVKDIFNMSISKGARAIAQHLNDKKEPTWGRGGSKATHWHASYVKKILNNPAVLGEYHPHHFQTIVDPNNSEERILVRVPVGEVLKGYYPAIPDLDLDTYNKAQKAIRERDKRPLTGGRIGTQISNLFPSLVYAVLPDPRGKLVAPDEPGAPPTILIPCRYKAKGDRGHGKYLVAEVDAANKLRKKNDELKTERWPYPAVEFAILQTLEEIDWSAVAGESRTPEQAALSNIAATLDTAAKEIKKQCNNLGGIIAKKPLPTLVEQLATLETHYKAATEDAAAARRKLNRIELDRGGLLKPLEIQRAAYDPTQREIRLALRAELSRRIKSVQLLPKRLVPKVDPKRDRTTHVYSFQVLIEFANGITRICRVRLNKGTHPTVAAVAFQKHKGPVMSLGSSDDPECRQE